MNRILEMHSNQGDIVFDPFFGSGSTAISSATLKRKFIGFECSREYCKLAKQILIGLYGRKKL